MDIDSNATLPINTPFLIVELSGFITIILTSLLLFPFFLFVQHQNREEDKKTSVYAIMNHFNFIVKFIISAFLVWIVCYPVNQALWRLGWRVENIKENFILYPVSILLLVLIGVPAIFFITIPAVQYILHFLLGLQRFLIYFFPDTEKYVTLSEKKLKVLLVVLYLIAAVNIVIRVILDTEWVESSWPRFQGFLNIYICLNILQLISVAFYIPIMISISKLRDLVSAAVHRPQKYIFYQILTHSLTRIIHIPIFLNLHSDIKMRIGILFCYEIFLTPLTIQVAYLLCNRKNVQTLLSFSFMEILRSILFPSCKRAQVQPEEVIESTNV